MTNDETFTDPVLDAMRDPTEIVEALEAKHAELDDVKALLDRLERLVAKRTWQLSDRLLARELVGTLISFNPAMVDHVRALVDERVAIEKETI